MMQDETIDIEVALLQEREAQIRQLEVLIISMFFFQFYIFSLLEYFLSLFRKWKYNAAFTPEACLIRFDAVD